MKRIALLLALATFALAGEIPKLDTLTTMDGKTYKGVTITKLEADGIRIIHDAGVTSIPFEQLSPELQQQLGGFDPAKAAQARADRAKTEAKALAALEAATSKQEKLAAEEQAKKDLAEKLWKSRIECPETTVIQITKEGVLTGNGLIVGHPLQEVFVDGAPVKACYAAVTGRYQYTSPLGETKTVRKLQYLRDIPEDKAPANPERERSTLNPNGFPSLRSSP